MKKFKSISAIILMATILLTGCASSNGHNKNLDTVTIQENVDYLTAINVVIPKPGEQQKIVDLLQKGMNESMRTVPGFLNATVHKSQDNEYVTVYAQWKDQEALNGAVEYIQAGNAPAMMQVFTDASPDFHPYQVVASVLATNRNKGATIKENVDYLTAINVVTPKPGEQQKVVDLLVKGMKDSMRNVPGFHNATVHKSLDNEYVTVYAQWESQAAMDKAVEFIQAGNAPAMLEVFSNAQPDFHPYEVIAVVRK